MTTVRSSHQSLDLLPKNKRMYDISSPNDAFVDHFSRPSYVHMHTSTGGDEAVPDLTFLTCAVPLGCA